MTPGEISEEIVRQANEYATLSDRLAVVLDVKPERWGVLRTMTQSDTSAERAWQGTSDGREETQIRLKLKSLDKTMSALKTRLRVLEGEARNLY